MQIIIQMVDEASSKIASIEGQMGKLQSTTEKSVTSWLSMATAVAAGQAALQAVEKVGNEVVGFLENSISAAEKNQNAMALVNNQIKNLGANAPTTAANISEVADKMAMTTTNSREMVLSAEQILLKFNKLTKETFPEATQVAADLAATLGTDMPTAADVLGKALENPSRAVRALNEAGLAFTETQKKILTDASKTGDVAKADAMILKALSDQLAGQSVASASTFSGKMKILSNDFEIFQEKIGNALLNALSPFIDRIMVWANDPKTQAQIQGIVDKIASMTTTMVNWTTTVAIPWIQTHWPAIKSGIQGVIDKATIIVDFFEKHWGTISIMIEASYVPLKFAIFYCTEYYNTFVAIRKGITDEINSLISAYDKLIKKIESVPVLGGAITKIGKELHIPGFASGTDSAPGGLAVVGENGPELVNLPQGSQVIPNNKLGGVTVNIYGNVSTKNGTSDVSNLAQQIGQMINRSMAGI